jgi:hypothetical protein
MPLLASRHEHARPRHRAEPGRTDSPPSRSPSGRVAAGSARAFRRRSPIPSSSPGSTPSPSARLTGASRLSLGSFVLHSAIAARIAAMRSAQPDGARRRGAAQRPAAGCDHIARRTREAAGAAQHKSDKDRNSSEGAGFNTHAGPQCRQATAAFLDLEVDGVGRIVVTDAGVVADRDLARLRT